MATLILTRNWTVRELLARAFARTEPRRRPRPIVTDVDVAWDYARTMRYLS